MTRVQLSDAEWEFIEPYLPIGEYGPYPERLRRQFEGVIWHFKTGSQWREMPGELGAWSTVHNRFRQWRDAGIFEALLEGAIAEAAKRGEVERGLQAELATAPDAPPLLPTPPAPTAPACANAASRPSFQRRSTRPPTGRRRAAGAAAPSATTPSSTRSATPSSA